MRNISSMAQIIFVLIILSQSTFAFNSSADRLSVVPQEGHALFIESIDSAKTSIDMMMYHLTDPEVVSHLTMARQRGLKVRIILDHQAMSGNSSKAIADQLSTVGVEIYPSTALFTITHAKAAVFDHQWALITTMNLTRVFYFSRDYGIKTYDVNIISEFDSVFEADIKNALNQAKETPALGSSKLIWSPVNSKMGILSFINSAQSSLFIEVENLGDRDVLAALKLKAQSGVKVVVLVPACVQGGGSRNIPLMIPLAEAGVDARLSMPPYSSENPYIHAKAIVVDQKNYYIGSENLSYNSLTQAREVGMIDADPQISSDILNSITFDLGLAIPVQQVDPAFICPSSDGGSHL